MNKSDFVIFSNSYYYEVESLYLTWGYWSLICKDNMQVSTHGCPLVMRALQPSETSETTHSALKHKLLGRINKMKICIVPLGVLIQICWIVFIHI